MTYDVGTLSAARLWPYHPDWASGFEIRRAFLTDITTSRSNRERRRAMRDVPRIAASYSSALTGDSLQGAKHYLRAWQNKPSAVPDFSRYVATTGSSSGGSSALTVAAPPAWMAAGRIAVLCGGGDMELVEIEDVSGSTVTLAGALASAWPSGSIVRPAIFGLLDAKMQATRLTRGAHKLNLRIAAYPGAEPVDTDGTIGIHDEWKYQSATNATPSPPSAETPPASGWSIGAGPFGDPDETHDAKVKTAWLPDTAIWLERQLFGLTWDISITVENAAYVYVDDVYVGGLNVSNSDIGTPATGTFTVTGSKLNILAVDDLSVKGDTDDTYLAITGTLADLDTFNGYEVFTAEPDFSVQPSLDHIWPVEQIDYGIGRTAQFRPIDRQEQMVECQFSGLTPATAEAIEQFFLRAKGRRNAFYRSTCEKDITLAANTSSVAYFDAVGSDLFDDFGAVDFAANPTAIEIVQTNGTRTRKLITGITASGGNSRIAFSGALSLTVAGVARISWLPLVRFASDELATSWRGPAAGIIRATFQTVKQ